MFKHEKQLFHPVEIEKANPQYAALLQEQLGGANGELKAAMQYMSQSFRIKDPEIKDLFLDIAAEELGHMEMVAQTINLLNGHDVDSQTVPAGEIESHVLLGLNPGLTIATCTARKVLKGFCDCCSGFKVYLKACYFLVGIDCNIAYISVNKRSVDFLTVNVLFRRFQYGFDFGKLFFHLSFGF